MPPEMLRFLPISFALLLFATACPSSERIQLSYDVCENRTECQNGTFRPIDGAECNEILNDPLPYLQCVATAPCVLPDGGQPPDGGLNSSLCQYHCQLDVSACSSW